MKRFSIIFLLVLLSAHAEASRHANLFWNPSGSVYTDTKSIQTSSSKYLDCGNHLDFAYNHAFTMSAWIKTSSLTQSYGAILSKAIESPYQGWEILTNNQTIDMDLAVDNSHYIEKHTTSNLISSTSTWYHLLWVYTGSGAASGMSLKINNVTATLTTDLDAIGTGSTTVATHIQIGRRQNNSARTFPGKIDDVAIWDADESANATTIYNSGHGVDLSGVDSAHLKFWSWQGDGTDVTDGTSGGVIDHSVSGFNCTSSGMTSGDIVTDAP